MPMHEQCLLWPIDVHDLILKSWSKMADQREITGFPILNIWRPFRSQISDMTKWISFILTSIMTYARTLMHVKQNYGPIQYGRQNCRFRSQTGGTFPQSDLSTEWPDLDNAYVWTMSPMNNWCTWPHFEFSVQDGRPVANDGIPHT